MNPQSGGLNQILAASTNGGSGAKVWPGIDGVIPHRGFRIPDLQKEESTRLPMGVQLFSRHYDLSKEDQRKEFEQVSSQVLTHQMAGRMRLTHIERHWSEVSNSMIVYMEWTEFFTYDRKETL